MFATHVQVARPNQFKTQQKHHKMKKKCNLGLILILLVGFRIAVNAQVNQNETLLTVGDKPVSVGEFLTIYKKNAFKESGAETKTIPEYLELFTNFKLKVREAESLKMDTSASFKNELAGYRKQLAQPYLTDSSVNEAIIHEAYERLLVEINASHILISCNENALPKDTLIAYEKIKDIRDQIVGNKQSKIDFETAAKRYSNDPSAKENGGSLGYFSVLQMVYPFENVAYNTPVGAVSMPVRTKFGFHLIFVHDKRPTRGDLLCAHIMIKTPKGMTSEDSVKARQKAEEILQKVRNGEDFAKLAQQFSDDKGSSAKGGELPWFGTNRMPAEFEKVAFDLRADGDVSDIFKTKYGWHIVKRIKHRSVPAFEEIKSDLKAKIVKDSRSQKGRQFKIAKIKQEYHFKEEPKNLKPFYELVDSLSGFYKGQWLSAKREKALALKGLLFTLNEKKYDQNDFALFLESHQVRQPGAIDVKYTVNRLYKQFVEESAIAYEEFNLDNKYPGFKALMQEYRDGILLFDLTDKKVWSKAVKDTAGLKAFYEANKQNYTWPERADATVLNCLNEKIAQEVHKALKKGKKITEVVELVNKSSQLNLQTESKLFLPKENPIVDANWKLGVSAPVLQDGKWVLVQVNKLLAPAPKGLIEAKGLITSDYQNYLEKEWLNELKKKYTVTINNQLLSTLK